ncbi:MAG TPA: glycoside hydrolase family 30 protein [Bryobacteraceae bacterium]|nr:glycoside hydrolase family 30 protein [Bryobacteraceae bacterium]
MRWLVLAVLAASAQAQPVQVYLTSQGGDRLASKPAQAFQAKAARGNAVFRIHDQVVLQRIDGFGASLLEASAICLNSLDAAGQEKLLRSIFDVQNGAGFSVMKTVLGGTDFMSAGGWYTYDDTPGDVELRNFSITRDLAPDGLVTLIRRARRYGPFVLQAPMDYPPDWMLVDVHKNQDVDPRYFDALARYYLRYVRAYEERGIFIDYLSLFNEPGVYTKIPYNKIRDLLKNHVGPLFAKEGVKTRLELSEAPERANAWRNYPTVLDDPEARRYVANVPFHGYGFKDYELIAKMREKYADLPFWMTEICYAYEAGYKRSSPKLPRRDYEDGDFWGNQIFSDLESGVSAWIYWNLILDEKGGPWLVSPIHGNPDPNEQHPVLIVDRGKKQVIYTGLYYYLSHFSKFVRPGAMRVETAGAVPGVRCLAFRRPSGGLVAQVMNSRKEAAEVWLEWQGKSMALHLPALSISSYLW